MRNITFLTVLLLFAAVSAPAQGTELAGAMFGQDGVELFTFNSDTGAYIMTPTELPPPAGFSSMVMTGLTQLGNGQVWGAIGDGGAYGRVTDLVTIDFSSVHISHQYSNLFGTYGPDNLSRGLGDLTASLANPNVMYGVEYPLPGRTTGFYSQLWSIDVSGGAPALSPFRVRDDDGIFAGVTEDLYFASGLNWTVNESGEARLMVALYNLKGGSEIFLLEPVYVNAVLDHYKLAFVDGIHALAYDKEWSAFGRNADGSLLAFHLHENVINEFPGYVLNTDAEGRPAGGYNFTPYTLQALDALNYGSGLSVVFPEALSPFSAIPEPATLILLGAGVGGLALARRRRASAK